MKYLPISSELFTNSRKNFVSRTKSNSIAIFHSNDEFPKNGDQTFIFKQNADFFYLTGIDQEQSVLILYPDCPNPLYKEVLFLRQTNEHIAVWEGHKYTKEEARKASGIENVYWLDEYDTILHTIINYADNSIQRVHKTAEIWKVNLRQAKINKATNKVIKTIEINGGIFMDADEANNSWKVR